MDAPVYDVDGTLANFQSAFLERGWELGYGNYLPRHWTQWREWDPFPDGVFGNIFDDVAQDEGFWLTLDPYDDAHVTTEVACYLTARPVKEEITHWWLSVNGFPEAPVHTVEPNESKLHTLRESKANVLVEDRPRNFLEMQEADGVDSILIDRPWNRHVETGRRARTVADVEQIHHRDD